MKTMHHHIIRVVALLLLPYMVLMSINSPEAQTNTEQVGSSDNTTDVSVVVLLDDVGIDFAAGDHDTSNEEDAPQTSTTGAYLLPTSEPLRPLLCRSHERIAEVSSIAPQSHNRDVPTPPPDNASS